VLYQLSYLAACGRPARRGADASGRIPTVNRRLYVLRHAKSSWDDPGVSDHDRTLAPRGVRATKLLAKHLAEQDIHPALILCSTALRARETMDGIGLDGERSIEDELYTATAGGWIARLNRVPDETESVMAIGHNPALQQLVLALAGPNEQVERKYPTAALATLTLDCAWSEAQPGCAQLTGLVRPRDLH
jgi:phosphohistidine phosphatase